MPSSFIVISYYYCLIYYQITTDKEAEVSVISIAFSHFILMVSGMISGTVVICVIGCIIGCLCGVEYRTAHKQASDSKSEHFRVTSGVVASDPVYEEVENIRPSAGIDYSQNISYGHGTIVTHL